MCVAQAWNEELGYQNYNTALTHLTRTHVTHQPPHTCASSRTALLAEMHFFFFFLDLAGGETGHSLPSALGPLLASLCELTPGVDVSLHAQNSLLKDRPLGCIFMVAIYLFFP